MITSIPKEIVLCCDGTWVASDKGSDKLPTNVTLMSRTIVKEGTNSKGEKIPQIVFYQAGVGTGSLGALEQSLQGAFGSTLNDNVCEAYNFLANNWAPEDEIFLFGFSRGAYTARAIAGLVCNAGLLEARQHLVSAARDTAGLSTTSHLRWGGDIASFGAYVKASDPSANQDGSVALDAAHAKSINRRRSRLGKFKTVIPKMKHL